MQFKSPPRRVILLALLIFLACHSAYAERQVFSGAIIRVRNSAYTTKALGEVNKGLPSLKTSDMQIEKIADGTLHIRKRRATLGSLSSDGTERPQRYSRKSNACYRASIRRLLGKLGELGHVSCEPNYALFATTSPNDPHISNQYATTAMSLPAAWSTTTGSNNLVVVVIDSGIDYTHSDLTSNIWTNPGELASNGIDDDGNGVIDDVHGYNAITNTGNPMDDNGHGTHCAGILGASGNNALGIAGVAWNVKIAGAKFLSSSGSGYTSNAVKAIDWATNLKLAGHNVILTSNSWGGGGYSQALADAITRAANAGLLFVAAAGNSSLNLESSPSYPASYTNNNIISVASTTNSETATLSGFSNYGTVSVDIAAPGSNIVSTYPDDSYVYLSGTSMAAPQISGIAILLQAVCNGSLSYSQVRNTILSTGVTYAGLADKVSTSALANAANAVAAAQELCPLDAPPPTATSTPTPTPTPTPVPPTATATPTSPPVEDTPTPVPTEPAMAPTAEPTSTPVRLVRAGFKVSPLRITALEREIGFGFFAPAKSSFASVTMTITAATRDGSTRFTCSAVRRALEGQQSSLTWNPRTNLTGLRSLSFATNYQKGSKTYNATVAVAGTPARLSTAQARSLFRNLCAEFRAAAANTSAASR
jgi:subtilisin family serine protease